MAHTLVKILIDDDGIDIQRPVWHLKADAAGSNMVLCTGEFYGNGESNVVFEEKNVYKGVPCTECKKIVKSFKSIRL